MVSGRGGDLYFEGPVRTGEVFSVSDGGETLSANVFLEVYTEVLDHLIQDIRIHASGSLPYYTGDQIGSMTLVGFTNPTQGTIGPFVPAVPAPAR